MEHMCEPSRLGMSYWKLLEAESALQLVHGLVLEGRAVAHQEIHGVEHVDV